MSSQPLVDPSSGNKEGEALEVPLPTDWVLVDLQDKEITLYDMKMSPPCSKIRMLLSYYKVPYQVFSGRRPTGSYRKVPALDIGDRQINDSFIITKTLAPILQGKPLTEAELELEKCMTYGLMVALEKDVAGNADDLRSCGFTMGDSKGAILWTFSCCIARVGAEKVGKDAPKHLGGPVGVIEEYGNVLREYLGEQEFLGGSEPMVIDLSIYGLLQPFDKAECKCMHTLLGPDTESLNKWFQRMKAKTADVEIF